MVPYGNIRDVGPLEFGCCQAYPGGLDALTFDHPTKIIGKLMTRKFVSLAFASSLMTFAGCATTENSNGRYLQIYRTGMLVMEYDLQSDRGCRELAGYFLKEAGGQQPKDAKLMCTNESLGHTLPVEAASSSDGEPVQVKFRMLSLAACNKQAEVTIKNDPKAKFTCTVVSKQQ